MEFNSTADDLGDFSTMDTEIRFEPTLFIFLGTSSAQIGWRLRQLLTAAYGDVPVLRYLWIDTDNSIDTVAAHWFRPAERVELIGFNGDDVLANLHLYPSIRAWWPADTRLKPGFIRRGANQVRLHGRLSLFRMFNDRTAGPAFIDKLRAQLDALQQIEHFDATERLGETRKQDMHYIVERGGVRVVIFYSTCGGTGNSISYDLAYLCRSLLRNVTPTIISVSLLPTVMDKAIKNETHTQWEKIRANTYAWFKEHEYLLENPYWSVAYPEGAPVRIQAPPFDLSFVVDLGNQAGDRLSCEDDIFSMVAQAIFLDTGSPIAGAMRGFNANVSVLMEEFQGRQRAYSSLAAASLIYPAEKILAYCSARLGQTVVQQGLLAQPDSREVEKAASAILGRLELGDARVLGALLDGRQIANLNAPAIRRSTTVQNSLNLLAAQDGQDAQERQHQLRQIAEQCARLLERAQTAMQDEIKAIILERGLRFAREVLQTMIADPSTLSNIPEDTASLAGLRLRIAQQGITEAEFNQAEQEYRAERQRLHALDGEAWQAIWRTFSKKSWQHELDRARGDCLNRMAEANQHSLQLAAQREAANLYNQLASQAQTIHDALAGVIQTAGRTFEILEQAAVEQLKPAGLERGIYELSLEAVDADYIQAYYHQKAASIDPQAAYQGFAHSLAPLSLAALMKWDEQEAAAGLLKHVCGYFATDVENTSLLDALTAYHGENAPQVIENLFNRLVRYCHPFWQYYRDSGIQGHEGKSLIGVEDEHSSLLPAHYRDSLQYEIKSTGFKHRIDVARVQHGLPAFLLRGMADYKAYYDVRRKGLDPMHVIPEAAQAAEVIPEERQEARSTFAVACAFGYVVQIGSWYYFDPRKEYASHHIHPGRENRLGQGRENAEEAFVQRDDLVHTAESLVETDVVSMGNRAAITLLDNQIAEARLALANMGATAAADNGLRRQFEKEIRALIDRQRQLGYIQKDLPLAA